MKVEDITQQSVCVFFLVYAYERLGMCVCVCVISMIHIIIKISNPIALLHKRKLWSCAIMCVCFLKERIYIFIFVINYFNLSFSHVC